jgi:hypothetical protein
MTDHDELCPWVGLPGGDCDGCDLIAKVQAKERADALAWADELLDKARASERERIASAIEAQHGGTMCYRVHPIDGTPLVVCSHERDARIARGDV